MQEGQDQITNRASTLVILGSARSGGNTFRAVQRLFGDCESIDLVDLNQLKISPYSYHKESDDDFLNLVSRMTDHNTIIFATPVYWYAMSSAMKIL
ncbi:MAG: NAD(P)H-dependent oxidoreductase, partial [Proteobacteria bacterium]|nr:NAD(P)H-dependent oxidoreductase [Pseudomonadota bacterium]